MVKRGKRKLFSKLSLCAFGEIFLLVCMSFAIAFILSSEVGIASTSDPVGVII